MIILDRFPIWAVYVGSVVAVLVAAEVGFRIGMWLQRRDPEPGKTPMTGAVVGGMLGLMAFLLAFSIGIVIGQHNGRKEMVVAEANVVGTAYLRAGFLGEPDRASTRDLLRETGSLYHLALCPGLYRGPDDHRRSRPAATGAPHRQPDSAIGSAAADDDGRALK